MIVGFSKYGTGAGFGAVNYLTSRHNPDKTERIPPPEILRGNPELVRGLIDSLDFKHCYTSGVLSFSPGEHLTSEQEQAIMDAFEQAAFAGLGKEQYSILWVRHTHAGHHELNFLIPRVELTTGHSLNVRPPGKQAQELFDTFRSMINARYGFSDPDDPARAQDISLPNHLAKLRAGETRKGRTLQNDIREGITEYVRREVDAGRITDRAGVERYLEGLGFRFNRRGRDYLTVIDPDTQEKIRLKGGLYRVDGFNPRDTATRQRVYDIPDTAQADALAVKLERLAAIRAAYHHHRYGRDEPEGGERQPRLGETLEAYAERQLGENTITPDNDNTRARSTEARMERQRRQQANTERRSL